MLIEFNIDTIAHAAERWDLEFFRDVWKPNSKSHLSAVWCLLLTPWHQNFEWVLKILSQFSNFEWVFVSNTTIFPKTMDFQWNFAYILTFLSTNLGGEWCYTRNSRSTSNTRNTSNTFNTSDIRNTSNTINTSNVSLPTGHAHL